MVRDENDEDENDEDENDEDENPPIFISKEERVGYSGKWKNLMNFMGYTVGGDMRDNPLRRRSLLRKIYLTEFSTDDEDATKKHLDKFGSPGTEDRLRRILGNLINRTGFHIGGGKEKRLEDPNHHSFGDNIRTFEDASWLASEYGSEWNILAYGKLWCGSLEEPLLALSMTWLPIKEKQEKSEWHQVQRCSFCRGRGFDFEGEGRGLSDIRCTKCGKGFLDDNIVDGEDHTHFESHADLIVRRFSGNGV